MVSVLMFGCVIAIIIWSIKKIRLVTTIREQTQEDLIKIWEKARVKRRTLEEKKDKFDLNNEEYIQAWKEELQAEADLLKSNESGITLGISQMEYRAFKHERHAKLRDFKNRSISRAC